MQSKGAIRLVGLLIAVACIYQLSFTAATRIQESKAADYAEKAVLDIQKTAEYQDISELDQAFFLDSLRNAKNSFYIDSITPEKVYLWFTYKEVKEREINLGLDLKGGMNVMMEVKLESLIRAMADYSQDPVFNQAILLANENVRAGSRTDYITLFAQAWDQVAPGEKLSRIFGTYDMRERIKPETTNEEILRIIRTEAESAMANSFNVLRNRIDRFGVTQPNIQRLGTTGRILVELPGIKEPERVRNLLKGTASLEFWETYENSEVYPALEEANRIIRDYLDDMETLSAEEEQAEAKTGEEEDLLAQLAREDSLSEDMTAWARQNPLFNILNPSVYNGQLAPGPCIGRAHYRDTATINTWLALPQVQAILPADIRTLWSVKPDKVNEVYYELIAIKANTRDGRAPLDGGVITDARKQFDQTGGGFPSVDMGMNAEGARIWARMTADNIGKAIAVVLDDMVYSYPRVNSEITGGRSQITGEFTSEEADDLANVLKSGKLPAPTSIVQESVVGPSLGSRSISSGLISFAIAFLLVLAYMIFFYNRAGIFASVVLLANLLFLFGALVSFGAVLTLPGIAGIVLTLGMAVDANVIIYERIKEELRSGKALRLAVADGYKNAYSAILDGNITTLITGIILMLFGSGPVQGFATTLVIGIITSLLTSIFITRLLIEGRLSRNKSITFDNSITHEFLQHTKIKFIEKRRIFYIIALSITVIGLVFMFTKGFTYGIDFTGGRTYVLRFDQEVSVEAVREKVTEAFQGGVEMKDFGGNSQMRITTKYMIEDESAEADAMVDEMLYNAVKDFYLTPVSLQDFLSTMDNPNGVISSEKVGPTVASDIKRDAIIAILLSCIAIFLYIAARFRNWTWGTGGLASLVFNTIFMLSFFSIFTGILPFTLDVDQQFIAAILTVIGYSLNDTVVIFDRIREYRILYPKRDVMENINEALNSTLSRTVNTSATTLVVLLAIAIFGGEVIRGFAVALAIGVAICPFTSVTISTPIVYDMWKRTGKKGEKKELKGKQKK
ncbi:MAG: protein translocase subunit SecDF [Bacteroidales bacterium]|jgi:SecD/SecF fusion protein|nr:protein translocase subunit SecDF [Bacteroidales bacterium]MDD2263383.1 protein translocase subunit SecDF [Bacteroidales bacterium]MDD2830827.1 protein translocase subunit SecDF [Bacteroidales bacterium]MDD3208026.1 protein translocase subunit SecDF [Bacteroidales bacterium]MDD3696467.1 protein translocase subunit SecDF [Bacteroidales bacterium]